MDTSSKPPLKQNSLRKQFAKAFAEELVTTPLPPLDYSFPEPEYDADGIAGADYHFVQELIAVATPPTTSDAPKNVVSELRGLANAPNSLLQKVLHILQDPPAPHAVTLATSHEQLDKALSCKFSFIKLSPGLVDLHGWTLEKQIASMGQGTGQAYQPAKKMTKHGETTHNVTSAVLPGFLNPDAQAPDERGTNILDMANLSGHRFYPDAILEQSLVHQIRLQFFKGSWSRSAQQGWESLKNEFMILTNGGVVSPIHCDQGGRVAYLFVIDGCKFWYGTKGQWAEVQKEFQLNGPRCPHYRSGMFGIQLRRGDALIQAPGTPHAVVTVENTLLAGIFIYTAATFSRSIECIRLNLAGLTHSNEEDGAHEYNELALVIEHIDRMDSVTAAQREEVRVEVGLLLQSEGVVYIDDRGEWHKSHEWASEAQKAPHRRSGNKTGKKSEASSNIGPRGAGIRKRTPAARGRPSSRRTASETQAIAGAASTAGSTRSSPPPTADAVPPSDPLEAKDAFLATCLKWWWPLHMARSGDVE